MKQRKQERSPRGTKHAAAATRADLPAGAVPAERALLAPYNSYGEPAFARRGYYLDTPFRCVGCGVEQVWTAAQQKWWYEVAKGYPYSLAKQCRACRRARQDRSAASRRVHLEGLARVRGGRDGR